MRVPVPAQGSDMTCIQLCDMEVDRYVVRPHVQDFLCMYIMRLEHLWACELCNLP